MRQYCGTFCVWADGLLMSCRCSSAHEPNFCSDGSLHSCASLWIHDGARSEKCRLVLNIGNYPSCVGAQCVSRFRQRETFSCDGVMCKKCAPLSTPSQQSSLEYLTDELHSDNVTRFHCDFISLRNEHRICHHVVMFIRLKESYSEFQPANPAL